MLLPLRPGGFVDPQVWLALHRRLDGGINRRERRAEALTTGGDAAQTDCQATDLIQERSCLALTEAVAPMQYLMGETTVGLAGEST